LTGGPCSSTSSCQHRPPERHLTFDQATRRGVGGRDDPAIRSPPRAAMRR
jgi:hypothetical protein